MTSIFSKEAKWIWANAPRDLYNAYFIFKRSFKLTRGQLTNIRKNTPATLRLTADAYYSAYLNGHVIGHGPAKSAKNRRSVDTINITDELQSGENTLEILVHSMGTGSATYLMGPAGLIFELTAGSQHEVSNKAVLVCEDRSRRRDTVRRWVQPCLEDVNGAWAPRKWSNAIEVDHPAKLYERRVPLPSYEPFLPTRIVEATQVTYPTFSLSLRLRPYFAKGEKKYTHDLYVYRALIVIDVISPKAQKLQFTPSMGGGVATLNGNGIFCSCSWNPDSDEAYQRIHQLKKGSNRLIIHHFSGHTEDMCLCGFTEAPVEFKNPFGKGIYQIIPVDDENQHNPANAKHIDWDAIIPKMMKMNPEDGRHDANVHNLAYGARSIATYDLPADAHHPTCTLNLPAARQPNRQRRIVDLGKVVNGYLSFTVTGPEGASLIFSLAEGYQNGKLIWPRSCNNSLTYHLRQGRQSFESMFYYGGRYIVIDYCGNDPATLENLRIRSVNCQTTRTGTFHCSDPLINDIYDMCVQTIISGTDDTFTDCPLFEQVNWNYDNRAAVMGDLVTCASLDIIRNSIILFAEDPECKTWIRSNYPNSWMNIIPFWAFHWIMWNEDYYRFSGDIPFIRKTFPRIRKNIEAVLALKQPNGLYATGNQDDHMMFWHFCEWGHGRDDNHPINTAEQAGFAGALEAAAKLAKALGKDTEQQRWQRARRSLIQAINKQLWVKNKRVYADSLHEDGTQSPVSSEATNAALLLYRCAPEARRAAILEHLTNPKSKELLPYQSPYGMYYVLEVLDQEGDVETLFKLIRKRWGDMVKEGDKTCWETFHEYGIRSRCHPFAAYVLKYLTKYILGVENRTDGFTHAKVNPTPPRGIKSAQGSVPTPHGLIEVDWKQSTKGIQTEVRLPQKVRRIP